MGRIHLRRLYVSPWTQARRALSTYPPLVAQIWGSNTAVGKTVISSGILRHAEAPSLYIKPVQTGYPQDDDVSVVRNHAKDSAAVNLYAYSPPTSPDLAARLESSSPVSDEDLTTGITTALRNFHSVNGIKDRPSLSLVETAGGVLSPSPSGTMQADVFRPLRLPALLVGDEKLGGISSTLTAYETLRMRGFSIPAVVMFANTTDSLGNESSVARNVHSDTEVFLAPSLPSKEVPLEEYFRSPAVEQFFKDLNAYLHTSNRGSFDQLMEMSHEAKQIFWYPFTQHSELKNVTCIDSAHGDIFRCADETGYYDLVDGVGSWWTNGVGHGNPKTAMSIAAAAGRYGHVMFPEAVYEPAFTLSQMLLEGVGSGWASRVFFSDNGSTAVEVALKMAFRQRSIREPSRKHLPVKILGIRGSYHGDTLGVMNCSEESDYNRSQTPWYRPQGLFLDPPTLCIRNGVWMVDIPNWIEAEETMVFRNRDEALSSEQNCETYESAIRKTLQSITERQEYDIGALLIEPVLLGAGGMRMVDPAFQRSLVKECRKASIPIVFDEIFTGFWRLGCESGSSLLGCNPDIATYGKFLTGGTVPLAVTLASEDIFNAFAGSSKRDALLHGHSYTAHAIGCAAGVESLSQYQKLFKADAAPMADFWSETVAKELSTLRNVKGVTCLGTVLAVELRGEDTGYASNGAVEIVQKLKSSGIFSRPLGNVIYVLCSPLSDKDLCHQVMRKLTDALESSELEISAHQRPVTHQPEKVADRGSFLGEAS